MVWPEATTAAIIGKALIAIGVVGLLGTLLHALWWSRRRGAEACSPDTPIHEAVDYIVNDSRAKLRSAPLGYGPAAIPGVTWTGEQHYDALEQMRQKAMLGDLRLWGHAQVGEPSALRFDAALREIPPDYWNKATFRAEFCFHATEHPQTVSLGGEAVPLYARVTLNRAQLVKAWPRKSHLRRLWSRLRRRKRLTLWDRPDADRA